MIPRTNDGGWPPSAWTQLDGTQSCPAVPKHSRAAYKRVSRWLTPNSVIEVRPIMPREQHSLDFDTFHKLKPGQGFELVNDHDPKPTYYQFEAEHRGILVGTIWKRAGRLARRYQ